MSRKRVSSVLGGNGLPRPNLEVYQYEYYRPGCYYIPQVACQVTPNTQTYDNQWQPYCFNATYVVDSYGQVYYISDLEYQLQEPSSTVHRQQEGSYNHYNYSDVEISSIPQIEEEDYDDTDVSPRKRERLDDLDDDNECCDSLPILLSYSYNKEANNSNTTSNVYRANEGYIVEEPNDNVSDKI